MLQMAQFMIRAMQHDVPADDASGMVVDGATFAEMQVSIHTPFNCVHSDAVIEQRRHHLLKRAPDVVDWSNWRTANRFRWHRIWNLRTCPHWKWHFPFPLGNHESGMPQRL